MSTAHAVQDAAAQTWPAFVLVTGLLLVGLAAGVDGVFDWAAGRIGGVGLAGGAQFACALVLVAVVTALLNLDTAVVFLTPVLLGLARLTGADEEPYLYAAVFMANASSLFLRLVAVAWHVHGGRLTLRRVRAAVSPRVTVSLFAFSVVLGTVARLWDGPSHLVGAAGRWGTAALGAIGAVSVNNLPASVLLSAGPVPHPRALLIGLNVGPNLAVTGSLSAFLWFQSAREAGATPSAWKFSRRGIPLALAAIGASVLCLGVALPHRV